LGSFYRSGNYGGGVPEDMNQSKVMLKKHMHLVTDIQNLNVQGLEFDHKTIQVNSNVFIRVFRCSYNKPITLLHHFKNEKPHVGFNFCCSGATSFGLNGQYAPAYADSSQHNNFFMPACDVIQELILTPELELITCFIEAETFIKLIDGKTESLPKKLKHRLYNQGNCYFESYPWQPLIKIILHQIMSNRMTPLAQKLFFESKLLEIVAIVLDMYAPKNSRPLTISKSDIEKIHFARELLLKDIINPPGLFELARFAGTNEFTLKKGFKELFEMPVYKYLHKVRMENAAMLLQTSGASVSEAAAMVGYNSFSSFTQAFSRYHGVNPAQLKNTPF
jgi:AraC-like DNA-binding protein